jgi:hypothetical protein
MKVHPSYTLALHGMIATTRINAFALHHCSDDKMMVRLDFFLPHDLPPFPVSNKVVRKSLAIHLYPPLIERSKELGVLLSGNME